MERPIHIELENELLNLTQQKQRYLLAIEIAEQSSTLRRHIRTVQRLDNEIAARKEVLRTLAARRAAS